jgi:phosphoribosylamine--glycine ligase
MKVLVVGSGGREHAICWKLKQSLLLTHLYCTPGNGGIGEVAERVALKDNAAIVNFAKEQGIGLVVIGPEAPLVTGLADDLRAAGISTFGPGKQAAELEGSKGFMKDLCAKYNIPTAEYQRFTEVEAAKDYIRRKGAPIVVKADGLAAGKGVIVARTLEEALEAVDSILGGAFGEAGNSLVVEEFLEGEELSFFALCDGHTAIEFSYAQDHKAVGEGDTGPNTGGMGTYTPPPLATKELRETAMRTIILPTLEGLKQEGITYNGMLFAGLMVTKTGPKLLEYNVRFGDPETQSMLMRLESDLLPLLLATAQGKLAGQQVKHHNEFAICVVMAAKGYPGEYTKGTVIRGLEEAAKATGATIFHAGTEAKDGQIIATGGRVLGVTARGTTLAEAQAKAYAAIDTIDWPEGFCRRDIGWRALKP